jgi:hypothetical protein
VLIVSEAERLTLLMVLTLPSAAACQNFLASPSRKTNSEQKTQAFGEVLSNMVASNKILRGVPALSRAVGTK